MFNDSYHLVWVLEDENGDQHMEEHFNVSLSDFEEIYGNNVHHVVSVDLKLTEKGKM